jgi:cold shock CspA family protein
MNTKTSPVTWTGTIARWNGNRGFGFIEADNAEDDIFMNASQWVDPHPIAPGLRVSFRVGLDPSGRPCAKKARAL